MPLETIPAEAALQRALRNRQRQFPTPKKGAERLVPFAQPDSRAQFGFDASSAIFTTGSCFARNIERALRFIDFNVTSSDPDLPLPDKSGQAAQLYNKYTVHSILNEITWALSPSRPDAADLIVETSDGVFTDLQISAGVSGSRDEMIALRNAYNDSFRAAASADVVIVTLGLVECWFDREIGVYLNGAPTKQIMTRYPGRFEFHLLDGDDIYQALCSLYELLGRNRDTPPRCLFTVSPVGLVSTFRDQDVLVANCYSKSVQRAALEAFVMRHDVDYFPSYETVTLSDHQFAWGNHDYRHVRQETVDRIMAAVLKNYVGPSREQSLLHARGSSTAYLKAEMYQDAVDVIDAHFESHGEEPELLWSLASALRRTEDIARAQAVFLSTAQKDENQNRREAALRMAENCQKILDRQAAQA